MKSVSRVEIENKYLSPHTNDKKFELQAILEFKKIKEIILEFQNIRF